MSTQQRRYTLKARAEHLAATRRRIVEATSELHEEVGPARTTVAEIARRAGVQRLTVYNHFPDDRGLFAACGAHWTAAHPRPNPVEDLAIEDLAERLHAVLQSFYGWYRETEAMAANIERDRLVLPALDEVLRRFRDAELESLVERLAEAYPGTGADPPSVRAALALALNFWTWRTLARAGLSDLAAADLMVAAVEGVRGDLNRAIVPGRQAAG